MFVTETQWEMFSNEKKKELEWLSKPCLWAVRATPPLLSSVTNNQGANAATDVRSRARPDSGLPAQQGARCSKSARRGVEQVRDAETGLQPSEPAAARQRFQKLHKNRQNYSHRMTKQDFHRISTEVIRMMILNIFLVLLSSWFVLKLRKNLHKLD